MHSPSHLLNLMVSTFRSSLAIFRESVHAVVKLSKTTVQHVWCLLYHVSTGVPHPPETAEAKGAVTAYEQNQDRHMPTCMPMAW